MTMPEVTEISDVPTKNLRDWLVQAARTYECTYLLAHAEDGVIWGRFDAETLITSFDVFGHPHCHAKLRPSTLWEARLFGPTAEVLVWRADGIWKARAIRDAALKESDDYIVEQQMLWGDHAEAHSNDFTLLADGREGLRHAVPITVDDTAFTRANPRPLRLCVRHYVTYDDAGNARIGFSRVVNLQA